MIGVHLAGQVRAAEHAYPSELADGTLMARAAFALSTQVIRSLREAGRPVAGSRVVLLVGGGNNGGDALHAGVLLRGRGAWVDALLVGERAHEPGLRAFQEAGGRVHGWSSDAADVIAAADVIVDGILGIGATGALREPAATIVERSNESNALRVAVDLPSGVEADTGSVHGHAFRADHTVTFAAIKPGLVLWPGVEFAGRVTVVDIGIDDALGPPIAQCAEASDLSWILRRPAFADHKYRRGVVGIAAGSPQYRGAALLCAAGALPARAGMVVYLDRGDAVAPTLVATHPEVVAASDLREGRVHAWACGPGFTGGPDDAVVIEAVLHTSVPVVLDAGALTALAESSDLRALIRRRSAPTLLTPHESEFGRLGGVIDDDRRTAALAMAGHLGAVILLKGPGTVIAAPDGTCFIDRAGTAALATAGSGDVLAGCLAGFLATARAGGIIASDADAARVAAAACLVHGLAGQRAAATGQPTASGIARQLGSVMLNDVTRPLDPTRGQGAQRPSGTISR